MTEENFSNSNEDKTVSASKQINLEKNKKIFKRYSLVFLVVFLLIGSFFLGYDRGERKNIENSVKNIPLAESVVENKFSDNEKKIDFSLFWKVWDLVKQKHIFKDELDAQQLVYGAINGMLRATGDPYSDFFDPKQTKSFFQNIEGSFDGIGAELGIKDDILTIIAPLDDSPAQKAGLRSGDKILKVDGKIVADLAIDDAVELIRGKKGTQVILTILHDGGQETEDVVVMRDTIEIKSVKISFEENEIAYLRISQFSENTDREFDKAISQIVSKKSKGIILDLRDNPGGLLDKAVTIASRMIPKDKIVVSEEDSAGKKEILYTLGGDKLSSIPMVVLLNEGSASAAEILAGALHDDQNITLIGKKSFGKGSVQQLIDLPGNSSVKITVAKWLTPNGDYIMEKGINPDIETEMTLDDYKNNRDPQLDKAMEVLKEKIK